MLTRTLILLSVPTIDMGKVLAGLQVPEEDNEEFANYLARLNYQWVEETDNPLYKQFFS
jgi:threonine dehydratase